MKHTFPLGLTAAGFLILATPVFAQDLPGATLQAISGSLGGVPMMIIEGENLDEKYGFEGKFEYLPHEGAFQNFLIGNADVSMDNDLLGVAFAREEGFDLLPRWQPLSWDRCAGQLGRQDARRSQGQESGPFRCRFRHHNVHPPDCPGNVRL